MCSSDLEHLYEMDYLQEGIGLRAMAQRDPLVEYQREGYDLFAAMMDGIKEESVGYVFHAEVQVEVEKPKRPMNYSSPSESGDAQIAGSQGDGDQTARNAQCPCGSGKKYKRCHGSANQR